MWALGVTVGALAAVVVPPPSPTTFVTDPGRFVSDGTRQELEQRLAAHERARGQQVLVWIGTRQADDASLEEWAARSFQAWQVGRKGMDDGVALFVLPAERKMRIEVGYGLEPYLTDARSARLIREEMAPRLQQGDPDGAVRAAVDGILAAVGPAATGQPPPTAEPERRQHFDWGGLLFFLVVALFLIGGGATHPAAAAGLLYTLGSRRARDDGGLFGGGGFGGGGFGGGGAGGGGAGGSSGGGFSGGGFSGGGGRSGGGGASGSW